MSIQCSDELFILLLHAYWVTNTQPELLAKKNPDTCRTPGQQIGQCVSIHECDYLLNILKSKSLSQQSIKFLQMSQCNIYDRSRFAAFVCCSQDSQNQRVTGDDGFASAENVSPWQRISSSTTENVRFNDSIINYRNQPDDNISLECGKEKIENRIYSGQVSRFP